MMSFFNNDLYKEIQRRLILHHDLYQNTVKSTYWEEILYRSLKSIGEAPEWNCGSHNIAYDLLLNGVKISCKSGTPTKTHLKFSGYRLTSHKTLSDKIRFITSHNQCVHVFLSSIIDKKTNTVTYKLFSIDAIRIPYNSMKWEEQEKRYVGEHNDYKADIVKSMSDQLWTRVPIIKLTKHFEIDITNKIV